ncbi:MAG: adenylyl-sulfate kinase [Bacteroidia bacterium]|nr:adenylyl-sulfate kinase [Bacteroidia bacterium]
MTKGQWSKHHPIANTKTIITRAANEKRFNQRTKVIWITGLSCAGKTTLATGLEEKLNKSGFLSQVLDGDNIRMGLSNNLGFSDDDRKENIRRTAEVSKLFLNCGIITICSFISPTIEIRNLAKNIIGENDFIEVFLSTPVEICKKRDKKGLYAKAQKGEIQNFTGIDSPYEPPENPAIRIDNSNLTPDESIAKLLDFVLPLIRCLNQQ